MKLLVLTIVAILVSTAFCGPVSNQVYSGLADDSLNSRIISGTETSIQLYPYTIAIFAFDKYRCGGSIISSRYILTAAHCLYGYYNSNFKISIGHTNYDSGDQLDIYSYYVHPGFSTQTLENDIAIIWLRYDIGFSSSVQYVYLDEKHHDYGQATVTGWGETQYGSLSQGLKAATVDIISNNECVMDNVYWSQDLIFDGMMCALDKTHQSQLACPSGGDAGSPLVMIDFRGFKRQVGVASWGGYPCQSGRAAVYTRVSKYYDWIFNYID